ncbi:MAG: monovalent cation/H+ antiporter complex subunit F [Gemmatimonadales bacterium]
MSGVFNIAALIVVLLMVPFLGRALVGPTVFDRVQALSGLGTLVPVLLVLIGMIYQREAMFVDLALSLFLLNLFTTLLLARYVRHKSPEEQR